uniref:Zinc finger protein-like 1 n=1 Tax=Lepisosteus oculatus TaxID=7918 RepID=W5M2R4_LEPOC
MVSQACAVSCASGTPDDWGALSPPPTLCVADVFHWTCLNELAARLPPNTAPAGYQCPACQAPVFPPANLASPVADVLRQKLSTVNWARAGLGLPLIEEAADVPENPPHDVTDYTDWSTFDCECSFHDGGGGGGGVVSWRPPASRLGLRSGSSRLQLGSLCCRTQPRERRPARSVLPRRLSEILFNPGLPHEYLSIIIIIFSSVLCLESLQRVNPQGRNRSGTKRTALTLKQRVLLVLLLGVLGFVTLVVVMSKLGRASADSDPNLDPHLNPHIRVGQN